MAATVEEIEKKMVKYKYPCEFAKADCRDRFKTKAGMLSHVHSYNFNYSLTEKKWEVECILDVFDKSESKLFLVQWEGLPGEDSW